jgi:23S rRNA (pseudouridine1915-N3)-methyltransferase
MFRFPGQLQIVAVGKMRTKHWLAAQNEYLKRLKRYGNVQLVEVKDVVGRGLPDESAIQREGIQLLHGSEKAAYRVLLTPNGAALSSEGIAQFLQEGFKQHGRFAFLIGGPLGFSEEVVAVSNAELSLSLLTFTHELARVILLEQLYRACSILNGEKYHK